MKIINFFDLSMKQQAVYAEKISVITKREEKMLSLESREIFDRRFVALMLSDNGDIISMIAVFEPEANKDGFWLGEVGMMYTDERFRGRGIGHEMYAYAERWALDQEDYDGFVVFLCEASIGIFSEANFMAENAEKVLPASFFEICLDHCFLNPEAEKQASAADELVGIRAGRLKARLEYQALFNEYKRLGKKGEKPLEILRANAHRAGLCCPLPAYKIFRF